MGECTKKRSDLVAYSVAGLELWMDARATAFELTTPPNHAQFLLPAHTPSKSAPGRLVIGVRDAPLVALPPQLTPLCRTEVWELWLDEAGNYVFVAPRQKPPKRVTVAADFASGEAQADYAAWHIGSAYPLQYLDIRLFANWLANCGDVLLHASGVAVDGRGYAFIGSSGAGKSTLAAALATHPGVTVLGEDQLAMRYLQGRFWIYGTPWHEREGFCSPLGVPLEHLYVLDREAPRPLASLAPSAAITRVLQTAFVPYYRPAAVAAMLDRLALLADRSSR